MAEESGTSTSSTVPFRHIAIYVSGDVVRVDGDEPNTTKDIDLAAVFSEQVNDPENKSLFQVVEKGAFAGNVSDEVSLGKACSDHIAELVA
jgi:hypothetical protein